jgi:hypothetical protein
MLAELAMNCAKLSSRDRRPLMETSPTHSSRPVNVIWNRATLDSLLEGHFIRETLLGGVGRPVRMMVFEPGASVPFLNDLLVVSFNAESAKYLRELRLRSFQNIGLFHMADESGKDDLSFYADADYVLRHYWFERALIPPNDRSLGVVWVPNGYRTGVGPISKQTMLGIAERTIMGFFAGALTGRTLMAERQQMMEVVRTANLPFIMIGIPGFAQGLGPLSYAAFLGSARFALVPGGNSPETVRLYDALEAGAIPIMLKSPFVHAPDALDNPPFLLLNSWSELPAAYEPFTNANAPAVVASLEAKRREIVNWWSKFKIKQQQRVKMLIENSFARSNQAAQR